MPIKVTETQLKSQFEESFERGQFPVNAYANSIKHLLWWIEARADSIKELGYHSVDRLKHRPAKIDEVKHGFLVILDLARQLGFSLQEVALDPIYGTSYLLEKGDNLKSLDIPIPLPPPKEEKNLQKALAIAIKNAYGDGEVTNKSQSVLECRDWLLQNRSSLAACNVRFKEETLKTRPLKVIGQIVVSCGFKTVRNRKQIDGKHQWCYSLKECAPKQPTFDPLDELETALAQNQVVFVTGPAGTGKSTLIKKWYENHKDAVLMATTGIAAQNLHENCSTIHSVFKFLSPVIDYDKMDQHYEYWKDKLRWLKSRKILVIEEASMLRADILHCVSLLLQKIHGNGEPFGGVKVILCGDMAQLPPVVIQNDIRREYEILHERYNGIYFFRSTPIKDVMNNNAFKRIQLTTVYRQQGDSEYLDVLSRVRTGKITKDDLDYLNSSKNSNRYSVVLSPTNAKVRMLNEQHFNSLQGTAYLLEGRLTGQFKQLPLPKEIYVKPGMKVLVTRNDKGNNFVNGTLGIFKDLAQDNIAEIEKIGGASIFVPRMEYSEIKIKYIKGLDLIEEELIGTFSQYPILPGYAMTVHRSQGQTYDYIEYHTDKYPRTHGLLYTMLSRVKSRSGLFMRDLLKKNDIYCDPVLTDYI